MMKLATFATAVGATGATTTNTTGRLSLEELTKLAAEINQMPNITWTAKAGAVSADRKLVGLKENWKESFAEKIKQGVVKKVSYPAMELADSFDSETNWPKCAKVIGDIRDQSNCGCCWAFGAASAASDRLCIYSNAKYAFALSAQETCFCASNDGCDGGDLVTPWMYIGSNGIATGGQPVPGPFDNMGLCADYTLPHCHHHGSNPKDPYPAENTPGCPKPPSSPQCPKACTNENATFPYNDFKKYRFTYDGIIASPMTVADIQQEIQLRGPVEAAFTVYSDFETYSSGIYKHVSGDQLGGHAIRIVGWGTEGGVDYWKVANSWNPFWGEDGYFRIVRGTDECGIEDSVTSTGADQKWKMGSNN